MPELPEVETIRRQLTKELVHKKVTHVEVRLPKLVKGRLALFLRSTKNAMIVSVSRRAKLLIIALSSGYSLLIHLKMTGQLVYAGQKQLKAGGHPIKGGLSHLPNKYTQAIFYFTDGSRLYFNDVRKFGYFKLVKSDELASFFAKEKYGLEPFSREFTLAHFTSQLARRQAVKIKPLLLDQKFIAGVGNIYATEACFYAGIKPTRTAGSLSAREIAKLYQAIKKILASAVNKQGSSARNYVDAYGQPGSYVPFLRVYGRAGERCDRCKSIIKALALAGRGTTYCPQCQR